MEVMSVVAENSQLMAAAIVIGVFAAVVGLLVCTGFPPLGVPLVILGILVAAVGGPILNGQDNIKDEHNLALATQEVESYRVQLAEAKFYLKEMEQKDLLHGEVKGSFGMFLAIGGGSIYGHINQQEKLTVVYYDEDTIIDKKVGMHRVTGFLLEEIDFITIGADEKPYFKFVPEIDVVKGPNYHVKLVIKENPQLYLPEGWQIIGASERY